jgi:integrase
MENETSLSTIVTSTNIDLAVYAWIDAKFHKSTSEKTRKIYTETINQFRGWLSIQGLDLGSDPALVAFMAQAFAGRSTRGKQVAAATFNQRLAVLSSFYTYAHKQGKGSPLYLEHNPIETLERAKVQEYAGAQPLAGDVVAEALARIDQETLNGKRDYALLCILLQTGRRAQEVADLTWGDVQMNKGRATLTFEHTKGNETMIDELPANVTDALLRWLHAYYGSDLEKLASETPIWVSLAHDGSNGKQLGYLSINAICKKHLGTSKVHATRHTFAHSMEAIGAPVSEIQARLGHKSLATTGRYLASLKRAENRHGEQLAALFGIE